MIKRILSVCMAASIFFCAVSFGAYASPASAVSNVMSEAQWDTYWETVKDDRSVMALTPGSSEDELNFTWSTEYTEILPKVRISKSSDMNGYREFSGAASPADLTYKVNRVTVTGLEENTTYYYSYGTNGSFSTPIVYKTHSANSFKTLHIGDIQCGTENETGTVIKTNAYNWQKTLGTALDKEGDISFILSAGDQTNSGNVISEWMGTLSPAALRSLPMATCIGNHDMKGRTYQKFVNNPNQFDSLTSLIYGRDYWFRYGDVLFMSFNATNVNFFDHYNFMEEAILKNQDATWRVAMLHQDFYGTGGHAQGSDSALLTAEFGSFFDKFEIDIALFGHEHIYGRSYHMFENAVVQDNVFSSGAAVDPKGTIYFTANSASGKNRVPDEPYSFFWLDKTVAQEASIYSVLEFSENSFSMNAYSVDSGEKVDEYKIIKNDTSYTPVSANDNALNTDILQRVLGDYYILIKLMSVLYNMAKLFI